MTTIKKICIDSRYSSPLSRSATDFRVDLKESLLLPEGTSVIITDISIPHMWYSVEYYSENLYFRIIEPSGDYGDFTVQLARKNYTIQTLATEIQTKMNAGFPGVFATS